MVQRGLRAPDLWSIRLALFALIVAHAHAHDQGGPSRHADLQSHDDHPHAYEHPHHECVHDKFLARLAKDTHAGMQEQMREANSHLNLPTTRVLAPKRAAELEFAAADPSRSISASRKLAQDDLTSTSDNASADSPASTSSSAQETPFDPIRFKPQYQLADADPDFAEQLRTKVMPRAMWSLSRILRLRNPVRGNLKLPRQCTSTFTSGPNTGRCAETGELCFGVLPEDVPESFFGDTQQCGEGGCAEVTGGEGIADADMAVFVTARATKECGESTTAHAVACVQDDDNWYGLQSRPLVGYINFCPRGGLAGSLAVEERTVEAVIDTAVHELIHTLFMSGGLFQDFLVDGGMQDDIDDGIIRTANVRSQVREHFDCPTAEGAPLEDQGGAGTASSHWEETAFFSEVMVGVASGVDRRVMSPITLALAVDSGWYEPNWVSLGFLRHGHLAGCEMLGDCAALDPASRGGQNFCASDDRCRNHDTLGWCADSTLSDCSLLRPLNGGDCKLPTNLLALFGSPAATSSGVHYGASAICVGVPNQRLSRPDAATYKVCVASKCADDGSLWLVFQDVQGGAEKEYECPPGEFVDLGGDQGFEENTRFGPCPPAEEVCPYKGCPVVNGNMCSAQGNCFEGQCYCAIDRSGGDCGNSLCWQDGDCLDGQFCSDTQECSWGTAPPPPPPMSQFDQDPEYDNYTPLVAVRVGYMRACVFFSDDNNNGRANLAIGERSQPSGPRGEVSLFLPGESATLVSPIRQEPFVPECDDSLSAKTNAALQMRASAGLPAYDGTITVFSTAGHLLRIKDAGPIATAFGIPEEDVYTRDWLEELVDDDRSNEDWQSSASVAATSIATVVTVEQVAYYLAKGVTNDMASSADSFLKSLATLEADGTARGGGAFACIRDTQCFLSVLSDAVQTIADAEAAATETVATQESSQATASEPPAAVVGSAPVDGFATDAVTLETESVRRRLHDVGTGGPNDATLAETVVMINGLIAQTYEGKGTEDFEGVLTRWAQLAFAAEGQFATLAGELGAGNTTAEAYTASTSESELERVSSQHNPDLAEATRLDEKNILEEGLEFAKDWLKNEQLFGIKGFQWVAIIVTIGTISIVTFCFCCRKNIEKAATVPIQAVSQRLARVRENGGLTAAFRKNRPPERRPQRSGSAAPGGVFVPDASGAVGARNNRNNGTRAPAEHPVKAKASGGGGVVLPPRGPPSQAYEPAGGFEPEAYIPDAAAVGGEAPAGYMGAAQEHTGDMKVAAQARKSPRFGMALLSPRARKDDGSGGSQAPDDHQNPAHGQYGGIQGR